jgi:cytochrome c-type protein NapC
MVRMAAGLGNTGGQKPKGIVACLKALPKSSLLIILVVAFGFGIAFWGALNTALEYTNRMEFCLGCHEMTIPYEEYKKTAHFKNRTGTTVTCADCHVPSSKTPGDYLRKVMRKVEAVRDIYGHWTGTIDTKEKFEEHRLTMAKREWARMEKADSQECRNCHKFDTMDFEQQKKRSMRKHEEAIEDKITCIECHKGVAHKPVHAGLEDAGEGDADKDKS